MRQHLLPYALGGAQLDLRRFDPPFLLAFDLVDVQGIGLVGLRKEEAQQLVKVVE